MATATRVNPLSYLTDQLNDLKAKGTHFRLRVLEDENGRLKRMLADTMLDNAALKDLLGKKW